MVVYVCTLAAVCALMLLYESKVFAKDVKKLAFTLVVIALTCIAGWRYMVGTDYIQYGKNYVYTYRFFTWQDFAFFSQPGIYVVAWLSRVIRDDYATWFFIMSVITVVPVMVAAYRYSKNLFLSVVMYLFLGCWHYSFNIVKQSAAAAILLLGYALLRDRKFWRWSLVCLAASMFHISALFMIPIFFLTSAKINWRNILAIVAVGAVCMFAYDWLYDAIDFLKQGEGMVSEQSDVVNNGVNILRILVNCVPVLLFAVFHRRYDKEDPDTACLFNMSLLNAVLNIASMNSIYLNRFCNYTLIFNILFFPILFKPLKDKISWWIKPLAMILYFAFWYYDLYKGSTTVVFQWIFNR